MKKRMIAAMLTAMTALSVFGVTAMADDDELVLFTWEICSRRKCWTALPKRLVLRLSIPTLTPMRPCWRSFHQAKGGDYDVIVADDYIIEQAVSEGLVSELDKDTITNFGNINPLYQGQFYDPDDKYTVPYAPAFR